MHAIHGNIIWNDADVVSFLLLLCDVAGAVAEHTKFHKNKPPISVGYSKIRFGKGFVGILPEK